MALYSTVAEYDEAIAGVRRAIQSAIAGKGYSLSKGGVQVSRESHSLTELHKLLRDLTRERDSMVTGLPASGGYALVNNVRRERG